MDSPNPITITELLTLRAKTSSGLIHFLDESGCVISSLSFAELAELAQKIAKNLIFSGLQGGGKDIIVTNFNDQRKHILTFWGCAYAGIPICPIPLFHPDETRQSLLLEHLHQLFHKPTFVSDATTLGVVKKLSPNFKTIDVDKILNVPSSFDKSIDAQVYPARASSPDETVALMLTSGSTGNSKGVVLPHTVLLSAVKGKALKHETKDTDIFLNWINFDHVANVTEVHLHAIWGGASQYQVEPSVIIRKPRNLLDWCSRFHVTHTFSPNFLLAQIYREMSSALSTTDGMLDLSSLRVFVTGGEANPVKTAAEFSDLLERFGAPRTTLRAAFGMTETAAGSIYNNSPVLRNISEYDGSAYLSVGTPAVGLRMRTIDPLTGFACPSNVVGQLQVSGTSVFSHYYANSDATNESFTSDGWFITGDLATIDDHGYLHILGRHKDVINVNGVKHPSVDVEHYIEDSNIRGVENSLVFVSALRLEGADTETYAVFYQHADIFTEEPNALTDGEVKALLATNRGIRNVCGVFCSQAPHVILPLPRKYCVKTALGKVSRSGLIKVYEQGAFAALERFLIEVASISMRQANGHASAHSHSAFDEVLCEGVAEVFGLDPLTLDLNQNIFDIGASSMHLVRLKTFLQDRFHIHEVPTIELLKRPIISQLSTYIQELRACGKNYQASYDPLICFNFHGSKLPLYLVHPGVGEVLIFINLARILNDDRPIYALRARGFEAGETPPTSMQEMIEIYTDAIERNNGSGPYFLAGYSFGAAVAVEIGKLLEKRGKTVAWVGVLNLPPFIQFRVQELTWVETMLNLCMFLALVTSENFDNFKSRLLAANPGGDTDAEPPNSRQLVEWAYAHCDRARLAELHLNVEDFHRWTNVAYDVSFTGRSYVPSGAVNGALTTVFCAIPLPSMGTKEEYKHDRLSKWKDYSGRHFEMIDVDGEHYTMISEEHVESFAPKMRAAIHRAEMLLAFSPSAPAPKLNFDAVPTIDFFLAKSDPDEYFKQLKFALEDVGLCIFINVPGFEQSFQDKVFDLVAKFYNKPAEWKASLGTDKSASLRGYFHCDEMEGLHKAYAEACRFGAERPPHDDPNVPFWLRIHEGSPIKSVPHYIYPNNSSGPNQWPPEKDLPGFRNVMETLFECYHALNLELNKHIAQLLGVPSPVIDVYFPSELEFNVAVWHYFAMTPEILNAARDGFANGMHEHRDPSTFLTCLIQSRPGLQVQNHAGEWIDVPMVEGGVVCNVGMQLMSLTGGKLVATTHRVNRLKIDKDRYTIPYVLTTKLDKQIVPLPQFDDPATAKMHVPPNPKVRALMAVEDPLTRSGYARLSLFPAAAQKMYPKQWEDAQKLGIV